MGFAAVSWSTVRLNDKIDLRADFAGLRSDYESSTIGYKFYEVGAVPGDEDLLEDLEAVLRVYDRSRKLDDFKTRKRPGCREPRRKVGLAFV